ncbi:MAG: carbohydrate ABC transporter permease [Eubacterium sp.]|nr:carbohydrate ABC transporter permease [Eubacterium sp.]MEE3399585.1 carbohydrate ABC transporter permease [Eubacterium sp.]
MKKVLKASIKHITLSIISFAMIFPMIWMVLGSVKTSEEALDPTMILPDIIHLENVIEVVKDSPLMKYIVNSLVVAIVATLIQIVTGAMLAYAFSFIKFKGRNLLFGIVMATYMLPSCATYIPAYVTLAKMGMLNTRAGLIISQCVSIFGIFLLRTAFLQVPDELIEAAKLDGANDWNILWKIVMPVTRSSFVTFGLMSFISLYNNYMWPSLITKDKNQYLVAQGLRSFFIDDGAFGTNWAKVMAGSTVIVIPLLILFAFTQRWFISGLSGDSGVKE